MVAPSGRIDLDLLLNPRGTHRSSELAWFYSLVRQCIVQAVNAGIPIALAYYILNNTPQKNEEKKIQ